MQIYIYIAFSLLRRNTHTHKKMNAHTSGGGKAVSDKMVHPKPYTAEMYRMVLEKIITESRGYPAEMY